MAFPVVEFIYARPVVEQRVRSRLRSFPVELADVTPRNSYFAIVKL
jgi:hypothetical protein